MASVKTITLPDGSSYDFKATYDIAGNNISETYINKNEKGVASGVASLDSNGMVPSTQLPCDVINTVTLSSSDWALDATSGYYKQIKTVTGMTSNSKPESKIKYPSGTTETTKVTIDKAANMLVEMETDTNSVSFYAVSAPTTNLTIYLKGV